MIPGLTHSLKSYMFLGGSSPVVAVTCNMDKLILGKEKLFGKPSGYACQHTVLLRLFTAFSVWFREHHNRSHVEPGTCRRGI